MDCELRNILREVGEEGTNSSYTHTTLSTQQTKWHIPPQNKGKFWIDYCDLVYRKVTNAGDGEHSNGLCIAERTADHMPLVVELLFKFQLDKETVNDGWEPYGDDFLKYLCNIYQEVLMKYFRVTEDTLVELIVVILESSTSWFEDVKETGQRIMMMEIRLHFPYAHVDSKLQNNLIRPKAIQALRRSNILAKMQRQPLGDWEQIISSTSTTKPLTMYGSTDHPIKPKLEITHIWSYINEDVLEESEIPNIELMDCFIPENHVDVTKGLLDKSIFANDKPLSYWLPIFLSIGSWPLILLEKEEDKNRFGLREKVINTPTKNNTFGFNKHSHEKDVDDLEFCEKFVTGINPRRFTKKTFWLDIGQALYSSDEGGENGLFAWIAHTERALTLIQNKAPDFMLVGGSIKDTCKSLYYTFSRSYITVETLGWYFKEDYPERYAEWHERWCMPSMESSLSALHTDVADAFRRVFWLDLKYCSKSDRWMQFKNHRYSEVCLGLGLNRMIRMSFIKRYEAIRMVLSKQIHESEDESFRANSETTVKRIGILVGKLKQDGYQSTLIRQARNFFENDRLTSLLDTNPNLTGVTNGVLEVCDGDVLFRASKPEDYISMCSNIPYHDGYSLSHPLVKETMKWLGQIFSDKDLLHYFLKFAASCLRGKNSDKIFSIWTGDGDNSKSMLVKLFEAALGSYCIKFPVSMLTEKNTTSSGPTPQLARARCTKVAFLDEPEDDVPMQKGTVKRLTGGDSFFARLLQENGGDVQATFKLILMCNKVPIFPNADSAIKRRSKLVTFLNTWILEDPNAPPEGMWKEGKLYFNKIPEEGIAKNGKMYFKMDITFERRIPFLAPAFLWILSQYFPYYYEEGLHEPEIVIDTTQSYWKENDIYSQFAADLIQEVYVTTDEGKVRDKNAKTSLSAIYSEFKSWFRDTFPGAKLPERPIVKGELSSRWGRMVGNSWLGIRIVDNDVSADMLTSLLGKKQMVQKPILNVIQNPVPQLLI